MRYLLTFMMLLALGIANTAHSAELDLRPAKVVSIGYSGLHIQGLKYDGMEYNTVLHLFADLTWQLSHANDETLNSAGVLDLSKAQIIADGMDTLSISSVAYAGQSYNAQIRLHMDGHWSVLSAEQVKTMQELQVAEDFSYETQRDVQVKIQVIAPSGNPMQQVNVKFYIPAQQANIFEELSSSQDLSDELAQQEVLLSQGQTNEQGILEQKIPVASHVQTLRVVASAIGVPDSNVDLSISGDTLEHIFDGRNTQRPDRSALRSLSPMLRASSAWLYRLQVEAGQLITGNFDRSVFDNSGQLTSGYAPTVNVDDALLNKIAIALPERRNVSKNAPYYITDDDGANLLFTSEAEVFVTFVHEGAGFRNAFGFFSYPDGNPPSSRSEIQPIVIFPNASYHNSGGSSNGLYLGDTVSLGSFPAGTRIGFFVAANGWEAPNSSTGWEGGIKSWMTPDHGWVFHTLAGLNAEPAPSLWDSSGNPSPWQQDLRRHTVLLDAGLEDGLVLGIEDILRTASGCDHDFNDIILIVNSNPVTAIDRSDVVALPEPIDSDNDGIFDANDAYPNDPEAAFNTYYPSQGQVATMAFEDLWPTEGDYDLNDLVVVYHIEEVLDAQQRIKRISASFELKARGAEINHGFAVGLGDLPASTAVQATTIWNSSSSETLSPEAGQSKLVYVLLHASHEQTVPADGCQFFNTEESCRPATQGGQWTVEWVFDQAQSREQLGYPPYNPFIYHWHDRGLEVHLADKAPSELFNSARFGTEDDDSNPNAQRYFKTEQNLPWTLNIPAAWRYPLERVEITKAYTRFGQWAQSSGQAAGDWYLQGIAEEYLY